MPGDSTKIIHVMCHSSALQVEQGNIVLFSDYDNFLTIHEFSTIL